MNVNELTGAKSRLRSLPDQMSLSSDSTEREDWQKKLADLGFSILGQGFFGMVFSNPSLPYVLKIFTARDHAYVVWLKYCLSHRDNPHVPKFRGKMIRLSGDVYAVRMEKLTADADQSYWVVVLADAVLRAIEHKSDLENVIRAYYYNEDIVLAKLQELEQEFPELLATLETVVTIYQKGQSLGHDVHPGNIMYRGRIPVITDPLSSGDVINNFLAEAVIDNLHGWGSTPNNIDIDYFGMRVLMKPSTFLELAYPLSGKPSKAVLAHIQAGGAIAAPTLYVDIPEEWKSGDFSEPARVTGHEGRNRCHAILELEGDAPIETHVIVRYLRARHLTADIIKHLNSGLCPESSKSVTRPGPYFTSP